MPANLENSVVARGLENVSFHSNPRESQCQRMLKQLHDCTLSTYLSYNWKFVYFDHLPPISPPINPTTSSNHKSEYIIKFVYMILNIIDLQHYVPWRRQDNSLQHSLLENPLDGGVWWAMVHKVTKTQTQCDLAWITHNTMFVLITQHSDLIFLYIAK